MKSKDNSNPNSNTNLNTNSHSSSNLNSEQKGELAIVLDTNVLVSAFIAPGGNPAQILDRIISGKGKEEGKGGQGRRGRSLDLYLSKGILDEARRVLLEYERLRENYNYSDEEVRDFLNALKKAAQVIVNPPSIEVIEEDPDDDEILACALAAEADYIVSGDSHLKDLKVHEGIEILAPAEFLAILGEGKEDEEAG